MRIVPTLPAQAFKTFKIVAPLETHWREATCEEVECPSYARGWKTIVDEGSELGVAQAYYIRNQSGRSFCESKQQDGLTVFLFRPGQPCFRQHRTRVERPELFLVTGGDWRGNPLRVPTVRHTRPEYWVEDCSESLDALRRVRQRG